MKKIISIAASFFVLFSFSACSKTEDNDVALQEEAYSEETTEEIVLRNIELESAEGQAVSKAAAEFLDTFISCDIDKIKKSLCEEDLQYFNFDSEDQIEIYNLIFPKLKYEFHYVSEHKGTYGVMTTITSPDMADVYGTLITERIDRNIDGSDSQNDREWNNKRMREILSNPDISERVETLYVYVEYIDGEYVPRCDIYLANELIGGAAEIMSEISSTLNETISALGNE
ncbi:MAG: hypothetical protein ACI3XA_09150 [Clostridia bacterium]